MPSAARSWRRLTAHVGAATSRPSISMTPSSSGAIRSTASSSDDLPAPVRPTTPTRWPCSTERETRRSTGGSSGA
eukprot:7376600-Prymnesium_polylepis.1